MKTSYIARNHRKGSYCCLPQSPMTPTPGRRIKTELKSDRPGLLSVDETGLPTWHLRMDGILNHQGGWGETRKGRVQTALRQTSPDPGPPH